MGPRSRTLPPQAVRRCDVTRTTHAYKTRQPRSSMQRCACGDCKLGVIQVVFWFQSPLPPAPDARQKAAIRGVKWGCGRACVPENPLLCAEHRARIGRAIRPVVAGMGGGFDMAGQSGFGGVQRPRQLVAGHRTCRQYGIFRRVQCHHHQLQRQQSSNARLDAQCGGIQLVGRNQRYDQVQRRRHRHQWRQPPVQRRGRRLRAIHK